MSFYGLNRAALNAGVSGFIAGAAVLAASSVASAQGIRTVFPDVNVAASAVVSFGPNDPRYAKLGACEIAAGAELLASGTRVTSTTATAAVGSSVSAIAGLLQLHSANIGVTSRLLPSYTDAYIGGSTELQATVTLIQAGRASISGLVTATAEPLVDVGFAGNISVQSVVDADARIKFSGASGYWVDGYARPTATVVFSPGGVRFALPTAHSLTSSSAASTCVHQQSGRSDVEVTSTLDALGTAELIRVACASTVKATGLAIRGFASAIAVDGVLTASPTCTQFGRAGAATDSVATANGRTALLSGATGQVESAGYASGLLGTLSGSDVQVTSALSLSPVRRALAAVSVAATSSVQPDGRYAELGAADASLVSDMQADGKLAELVASDVFIASDAQADGRYAELGSAEVGVTSASSAKGLIFERGYADVLCISAASAIPARMIESGAFASVNSTTTAFAYTNLTAPDPDDRVVYRQFNDTTMRRPFVDREMRRTA